MSKCMHEWRQRFCLFYGQDKEPDTIGVDGYYCIWCLKELKEHEDLKDD